MEQLPALAAVLVKSCQGADIAKGTSWYLSAWLWLRYVLFSYCPQHLMVAVVHLLFVAGVLAYALYKLAAGRSARSGHQQQNGSVNGGKETRWRLRASTVFTTTLYSTVLLAVVYLAVALWRLWLAVLTEYEVPLQELIFSFSLALAWLTFAALVGHQKKFQATQHSAVLRAWWTVNFVFGLLGLWTSISRFVTGASHITQLWVDNVLALATFPVVAYLFVIACIGSTGLSLEEASLHEPLLSAEADGFGEEDVTGFASAGFFGKLTWSWVNPLLARGKLRPLVTTDIPQLAPDDQAERLYDRLHEGFVTENGPPRTVGRALVHTFWPTLAFTGFLCLLKLSVMYVGPLLITQFVAYAAGEELFPYEGIVLVAILFTAKLIEVLSSHHYNFWSQKLGMTVRSSLITTVYRKGLRLSSHARQEHGVGQIVNYMSVDVQQISDSVVQLHNVWLLPLQTAAALVILYTVIGVACFGGIAVMVLILGISFAFASLQRMYQGMIMSAKDRRMSVTSEVLNSMKIIKLQAWEDKFRAKVESVREGERSWLTKFMYALSVNIFFLWLSPLAVSTATFALCVFLGTELTASKVFTALSTFRIMQEPLRLFPQALMSISQALNSVDRLQRYMVSDELDKEAVERGPVHAGKYAIEVDGGVFKWLPEAERPTLTDINLHVEHGSFVAIVGQVGSGKSALLMSLLGEVPKLGGTVKLNGRTAYVAQSSWIQNATIQDNILFGKPLDRGKYQETVRVCSLQTDFAQMTYGDQTEIGERGINLSGGQKQRIQLARAVYQDADIYFLDDIFSAVDATTGSELFQHCVRGALAGKTILLVTHQVDFLPEADLILVLRDGEVVQSGKYASLLEAGTDFSALIAAHNEAMELVAGGDDYEEEEERPGDKAMEEVSRQPLLGESPSSFPRSVTMERQTSAKKAPEKLPSRKLIKSDSKSGSKKGKATLIADEERATGQVGLKVYWLYGTKALKGLHVIALLIFQTCWQALQISSDYFLADQTAAENQATFDSTYFITRYSELALGSGFFVLLRSVTVAFAGLLTAQSFFVSLLNSIMVAPMSFFDTTPTGRILTRFTTDQTNVDILIPILAGTVLGQGFQAAGIIVVVCQVTWQLIIIVIPVGLAYFWYQRHFITTSREVTRLDSLTKSPVINHFSETISGFTTIRAFQQQERFSSVNVQRVNANLRMDFHNNAATEWLGFRLEFLGTLVLSGSALLMVTIGLGYIDSEKVGLSLSYGLALNGCMYGVVYIACQLENKMVSVERINQYCNIPREAAAIIEDHRPAEGWPQRGAITLKNLKLRYRPDTPLVLKGIDLTVQGGQKVGVVGRTGSGKSTLILAIFRLVEPDTGKVIIDDLDISTIGLKDLRSKFSIIPQDPTLFDGTVRSNIDPLEEHTDPEIWEALEKCQLAPIVKEKEEKLDTVVLENGENWSVGQRQLFCLGRAILKHSKILVLDEATASVDSQTDAIIQKTIKTEFADSTVISIAHRIPTVMDSDKVLVLDAGYLKEFDSPSNLLDNHHSLFSSLVHEYTARSASSTNVAGLDDS